MRTMFSRVLRGACLVAALATAGLWVRSQHAADQYVWRVDASPPGFELIDSRAIETVPGRVVFRERTALM